MTTGDPMATATIDDLQKEKLAADHENSEASSDPAADRDFDYSCDYSSQIPAILKHLNLSLAFTSYQAARLMIVRTDGETLDINYKAFPRPMGLTTNGGGLTLGIFTQIIQFSRVDELLDMLKKPLERIENDITAPRLRIDRDNAAHDGATEAASAENGEPGAKEHLPPSNAVAAQDGPESDALSAEAEARQAALHAAVDSRVDACYITRSAHHSGMINIHDIEWGDDGLWAVNSSFSCLCLVDADYSFIPRWKPHFISELVPEDRCHLNGMTLKDGKPAYVTAFSTFNERGLWRHHKGATGILMDVERNEILLEGLHMPHSPRWHNDKVYFCNSGLGTLDTYCPATGKHEVVAELPGFTRGIEFYGSLAFVGLSQLRPKEDDKDPLPIHERLNETTSGIWLVNLETGEEIGRIAFSGDVDQIYDVTLIRDCAFPEFIEPSHPRMRNHFCLPHTNTLLP